MASVLATIKTFVCSVCDKAFDAYGSCAKHTSSGRVNPCRREGATVKEITNIVGVHDRNVGGRLPAPVAAPPVDDSELNGWDDQAAQLESESSGSAK